MSDATYTEENRATQRAVLAWGAQRLVSDLGSSADGGKEKRQLSDFYGVDEPSLNSFIYAQRPVVGLPRPAKRSASNFDRLMSRPGSLARARPATMPAATFTDLAEADNDRTGCALPQPKVARSDSLLSKARRVFSMPTGRRPSRFAAGTPSAARGGDGFERRPRGRSHLSHHSRRPQETKPVEVNPAVELDPVAVQRSKEMQERIKLLETEIEAEKRKSDRQVQRIAELEEQILLKEEAVPALNSIISTMMKHFEAKESALKLTIAQMRHNFTTALAEKNEALRLYDGFDGDRVTPRSSTPGSMSTVSESGTDNSNINLRRVQSLDTHRRAVSPRSFFTNPEFEISR